MSLTLIRHRFWSPERIARSPMKCRGGFAFTHPPKDLWRYNQHARRQAIKEWTQYGAAALASIVGGVPVGMALTSGLNTFLPNPGAQTAAPGFGSVTLTTTAHYQALVFRAPKTGLLRAMGVQISAVVGSPTADFQFETVDATTGLPTGTLFATNTSKTGVSVVASYQQSGDFTADASVTQGDLLAAVIRFATGTSITTRQVDETRSWFPYLVGNATKSPNSASTISVKYSDGTYAYIPGTAPFSALGSVAFNSGSTPNHRGNQWTAPVPVRAVGAWVVTSNAQNYDLIVATDNWDGTADNDGTSNLAVSVDKDQVAGTGPPVFILSSTSLPFTVGTIYRAILKPGASSVTTYESTVSAAAIYDQLELGQTFFRSTATNPTNAASWSPGTTSRPYCGFWVDQFDNGASTGVSGIIGDGSTW